MATKPQETIFEYEQKIKRKASEVLALAKKQELKKRKTHVWVTEGKTSILKKL
jgi:hypothetical protein